MNSKRNRGPYLSELVIYEKDPMGGTCGFPAELPGLPSASFIRQELIRKNKIVKQLENSLKISVKRIFLKTLTAINDLLVQNYLKEKGNQAFPIFLYNKRIIHSGNFPDFETLSTKIEHFGIG